RICDLAAQIASRPKLLLLDEPTAGIAQREAEAFGPLLRRIRDELDCSILVIEHDMPLLMGLCDRIYAMEAGAVIAEGTPDAEQGEALALLGTNGAGKSTVLRAIAGLEKPARGHVRIDGADVTGLPAEQLVPRGVVLIPGGKAVFPDLTVAENLDLQVRAID